MCTWKIVVVALLPLSFPRPSQAVLSSDKLRQVIAKAKAGDPDAREALQSERLYYQMLEGSPGLMDEEESRNLKLIRAALGSVPASAAFPPAMAPSATASPPAARSAAPGSPNPGLSAAPDHNAPAAGNEPRAQTPESLISQGEELLRGKRYEEARRQFEQAVAALDPKDPRQVMCLGQLGRLAVGRRDIATARKLFTQAVETADRLRLKKGPALAEAYLGLGLCLVHDGDKALAVKMLRKGLKSGPDDETRGNLQRALEQAQRRGN